MDNGQCREAQVNYQLSIDHSPLDQVPPGYKRTEVGVIPGDWDVRFLGDLCERIRTGKLDANAMIPDGEYPFFTCAKERYWINTYAFDEEALFVSGNGANVGYIHYYKGKFNAYQRTYVLSGFLADIQFIKLFLERNLHERLRAEVNAGNTPYIIMDTLAKMRVALPAKKEEQRAIATALSDVDTLITALDRLIAKKRAIKTAAMQQLLTGKTRLPGFTGEWETKRLEEVAQIDPENLPASTSLEYRFNYISLEQIEKGNLLGYTEMAFRDAPSRARRVLRVGDVLLSTVRPNLMSHYLYNGAPPNAVCSTGFSVVRAKTGVSEPAYIFAHLFAAPINGQLEKLIAGSNYPAINSGDVQALELPCPPSLDEERAIAQVLSDMDAEIAALEARRDKTRAIKQGMMQQLLTGRVRLV